MATKPVEEKKFMTPNEAAQYTGFAEYTLRKWRSANKGDGPKYYKIRGRVRYAREELERFVTQSPRD